jgi:hypothetical protein
MADRRFSRFMALAVLALFVPAAHAREFERLEVFPTEARLDGPNAAQRFVVLGLRSDGSRADVTTRAILQSLTPQVALVDETQRVRPVGDGEGQVLVRVGAVEATLPVRVSRARAERQVGFRNEIIPALTKLTCNQGACHGSQHGKGGFKLSLLGFEPEADYTAIIKGAEGRRASPALPEDSLLMLKATLQVPHGGGKKLGLNSPDYALIQLWLEQGAPPPTEADPVITDLRVFPAHRILEVGETQRLVVQASYSDGTVRDVTDHARYDSLNDGYATVTPDGQAQAVSQGETNIMVRYQGRAAMARLTVPYARNKAFAWDPRNFIDELAADKWRELGLTPSGPCTDAEFLRRAMLDAIGTTPTPEEIDAFLADTDPEKRVKLIDRLLERPEYVPFWVLKWGDILRVDGRKLGPQGMLAFNRWLIDSFRDNKPVSRMVEELVTAQGSIFSNGPANYFRVASNPEDLAETTAQVFMGVRLQCAKCHHHPFEAYGQDDYYGLAAYFTRIKSKRSQEFGIFVQEQVVYVSSAGEIRHPKTGKVMTPTPLNDASADDPVDRRRALAQWLTRADNPWLARNVINRYWGYLLGRGLVNPIDDLRDTNPPSIPTLMDALAADFVAQNFDLKALLRRIMTSRVYELSSRTTPDNRLDTTFFTHYTLKRLTAEQLLDAINFATGTTEKFPNLPAGKRAIELPDTNYASYFLDTFGRPNRAIACECERSSDPNLSQALHLMNGDVINRKLVDPKGRLATLLKDNQDDEPVIQALYRVTFARPATEVEVEAARRLIASAPNREQGAQDLLWGLLNAKEFLFNH